MKMDLNIVRIVLLASGLWGVYSLQITTLTVPNFIENGTVESVVLDCEFDFDEKNDTRLVVKWFHEDDRTPIYQWIREYDTRLVSEKFKDRINNEYNATEEEEFEKYRALNLIRPTTEMSGKYSCQVTSLAGSDEKADSMIIYTRPTLFYLVISIEDDMVNVTCVAEGVFPVPELNMTLREPGEMFPSAVDEVYEHYIEDGDAFDVYLSTNISKAELSGSIYYFGCTVTLPGEVYVNEVTTPYIPVSGGYRPGLRRKIQSDASMYDTNDPEVLDLQDNFIIGVAAQDASSEDRNNDDDDDDNDDDDDSDGAVDMRPSVVTILILISALLVFRW